MEIHPGSFNCVLIGKASEIFDEIKKTSQWEKYNIGWKVYCMTIFNLN